MTIKPDAHYQVLEIEPGASQHEIKQAYRDLAKVWHPDRFSDQPRLQQKAEEKLKRINAAYEFLKSYNPQSVHHKAGMGQEHSAAVVLNCENLERLLELGQLKDADLETKRLLLELGGRQREGWLLSEHSKGLPLQALLTIDQLWTAYSGDRFGFTVQAQIWHDLGCKSSSDLATQTLSEVRFGRAVRWHVNNNWLSQWDLFDYSQSVRGSLPREYIFALNGWQSYSKCWIGYLLWRFDEIFLNLSS